MEYLTIYKAAIILKMSPTLIKWLTSYAPKYNETRKLPYEKDKEGEYLFNEEDLNDFNKYLCEPWPCMKNVQRPSIPAGIKTEIEKESRFQCVI